MTFLILLGAGIITFGIIAWATPSTYTAVTVKDLQKQVDDLADDLAQMNFEDIGPLLDDFVRSAGAYVTLLDQDGNIAETSSKLAGESASKSTVTMEGDIIAEMDSGTQNSDTVKELNFGLANSISTEVTFSDRKETYIFCATPYLTPENQAVEAMKQMVPWFLLALLIFSFFCSFLYSRFITRPIVRISSIAGKMAELDFDWKCGEKRRDEIGTLGRSLDQMAQKLSAALCDLHTANDALQKEVERKQEMERQRFAFFSAASHELKTPVTILKGQISGMLDGIGIYNDRDKYLARSLQVVTRMEGLIQEILIISRMEAQNKAIRKTVDLSDCMKQQLELHTDLMEQRGLRLKANVSLKTAITGDPALISKVVGNLLSNAILYSPEGAEIRVWTGICGGCPAFTVENTEVHIREEALPHLSEAFYREEKSRNRRTGGSGLGLYLVQMILKQHHARCTIQNTEEGVKASVLFPQSDSMKSV